LTDAGPGMWRPDKTECPRMTVGERNDLLQASIPERSTDPASPRYSVRRTEHGIEFFEAMFTRWDGEEAEFHGFPTKIVPASVLRQFRDRGAITQPEYRRELREQR
jgi:hypothetical protein